MITPFSCQVARTGKHYGVREDLTSPVKLPDRASTAQRTCDYTLVIGSTPLARFLQAYPPDLLMWERQSGNRWLILTKKLGNLGRCGLRGQTYPDSHQYLCSPDLRYAEPPSDS